MVHLRSHAIVRPMLLVVQREAELSAVVVSL